MKHHITNFEHQKYCMRMEETIQKIEKLTVEEKNQVFEKITEFKSNKLALEETYLTYQLKIKELSGLLDEYERIQQLSRINLRKLQTWMKYKYDNIRKAFDR
ncbi:MAG: hypothetical protein WKG06_20870 [Segetibacter sp.]